MNVQGEGYDIRFPLWHIAHRKPWLRGENASSLFEFGGFDGEWIPVFLTDEHLAIEFLDDSNNPELCTVLVRDVNDLLKLLNQFADVKVKNVAFDAAHPRSGRTSRLGWFIPLSHMLARTGGSG